MKRRRSSILDSDVDGLDDNDDDNDKAAVVAADDDDTATPVKLKLQGVVVVSVPRRRLAESQLWRLRLEWDPDADGIDLDTASDNGRCFGADDVRRWAAADDAASWKQKLRMQTLYNYLLLPLPYPESLLIRYEYSKWNKSHAVPTCVNFLVWFYAQTTLDQFAADTAALDTAVERCLFQLDVVPESFDGSSAAGAQQQQQLLWQRPRWRSLQTLTIHQCRINDAGMKALVAPGSALSNLTHLNLIRNQIGAEGVEALARSALCRLTHLDLSYNDGIGAGGAEAMARPGSVLASLTSLVLRRTMIITTKSIEALASEGSVLAGLTLLDLADNGIGADGARALVAPRSVLANLTSLDLSGNVIGDDGAEALAQPGSALCRLTNLDLSSNGIYANGIRALVQHGSALSKLITLNLFDNHVRDDGAEALAAAHEFALTTSLTRLDLRANQITAKGIEAITDPQKSALSRLHHLDLKIAHQWD